MVSEVQAQVLVIDDDAEIRYSLERVLGSRGYSVRAADSGESGITEAESWKPHVVFLDNRMEGIGGIETLQHLRSVCPQAMVILMTAFGTTQTAIEAMKFGAFDYIVKPFDVRKLLSLTEKAVESHNDLRAAMDEEEPESLLSSEDLEEGMVGISEAMRDVFKTIGQVAASEATVLITGESGTGKELVARSLVQHSHRSGRPYVAVNCAAIPDNLIESELFGHEKGAFTGATGQRVGKFEQCDGGTIFLDEIGDMAPATQTKILRALQEGEIQRVGGTRIIQVDVRLIAATNKEIEKLVEKGEFREDLYYRLNVVRLRLPALRNRREDIPQLIDFMLRRLAAKRDTRARQISHEARAALVRYDWPGNVRELENTIHRSAVVAQGDTILARDLPAEIREQVGPLSREQIAETLGSVDPGTRAGAGEEVIGRSSAADNGSPRNGSAPRVAAPAGGSAAKGEPGAPAPATASVPMGPEAAGDAFYAAIRQENEKILLQVAEKEIIRRALQEFDGNQAKAGALLGITRATLKKRIDQYDLG